MTSATSVKGGSTYLKIAITRSLVTWNRSLINVLFGTNAAACTLIPNATSRVAFHCAHASLPSKATSDSFSPRNMADTSGPNLLLDPPSAAFRRHSDEILPLACAKLAVHVSRSLSHPRECRSSRTSRFTSTASRNRRQS